MSGPIVSRKALIQQRGKTFAEIIDYDLTIDDLGWPDESSVSHPGLGGNRCYTSLPEIDWRWAERAIAAEGAALDEISSGDDCVATYDRWIDRRENCERPLLGLDLGTNALVAALQASGCLPYYSCNGGAFGDSHTAPFPAVAFYCRPQALAEIIRAARTAGVGMMVNWGMGATAYANRVDDLLGMARALHERKVKPTPGRRGVLRRGKGRKNLRAKGSASGTRPPMRT